MDGNVTRAQAIKHVPWSEQQVTRLKELYADKTNSCSDIAHTLFIEFGALHSRNSVIGKIHRLGLPLRGDPRPLKSPESPYASRRHGMIARSEKKAPFKERQSPPGEPKFLGPMNTIPDGRSCRYIRGEVGKEWQCCANEGWPYCGFHMAVCWTPSARRAPLNIFPDAPSGEKRAA